MEKRNKSIINLRTKVLNNRFPRLVKFIFVFVFVIEVIRVFFNFKGFYNNRG
jgi:hypothetical protein